MARKDYPTGIDSAYASDADYEDGFVASDQRIAEMAARRGISHDAAKRALGVPMSPMDRLRAMSGGYGSGEPEQDGPEY